MNSNEKVLEDRVDRDILSTYCALVDTQIRLGEYSSYIKSERALCYFVYGLSRRLQMIIENVRFFQETIQQNRKEPLSIDETTKASIHLNSLYVQLYGALDNIAWMFVYEKDIYDEDNIEQTNRKREVGLFNRSFLKNIGEINPILNEYREYLKIKKKWYLKMSELRAPSTHRMPLYVIPSVLNNAEGEQYLLFQNLHASEVKKLNFDDAGKHLDQIQSLGEFSPYFAHDPNDQPLPIYEVITMDCDNFVQILNESYSVIEATQ